MIAAIIILLILVVILIAALVIIGKFALRNAKIIFQVEDAIEKSLDVLDFNHQSLSRIAEKEIFFDSPEVRQAVQSIQNSRDAVLYVANVMGAIDEEAVEDEKEER